MNENVIVVTLTLSGNDPREYRHHIQHTFDIVVKVCWMISTMFGYKEFDDCTT